MVTIRLHEVIDKATDNWIYDWMGMNRPFSLDALQEVMDQNPGEGLRFEIHCDGGSVNEGLAIYDTLRTSGREIECNVEGDCHSMAIVILLAAPRDARTANPNSSFLIHEVQGGVRGNTTAVERYAEEMHDLQGRILDIYADRTGQSREVLETIMKEEKFRDARFMLEYGFIGAINEYNTNHKNMALLEKLKNLISQEENPGAGTAPGNEAQTQLEARVAELENERNEALDEVASLTAERDEARTQVTDLTAERDNLSTQVTDLTSQVESLTAERDAALADVASRDAEITNLRSQLGSHYQPGTRMNAQGSGDNPAPKTNEEIKNEVREKLHPRKK